MDKVLKEAIALREVGFAVHWLHPQSKAPVRTGWATEPLLTVQELINEYRRGFNIGFRAGKWSVVEGCEICVLDVDIAGGAAFAAEAHAAAEAIAGPNYTAISGSGVGRHYYLKTPIGTSPECAAKTLRQCDVYVNKHTRAIVRAGTEDSKPAWEIELLSTGKNVVMPPSIHPVTGQPYQWI